MTGYTTVNTFFDESGKFKDHKVICFGGVASYGEHVEQFAKQWELLLFRNGLKELSAKTVLNPTRALSIKNKDTGVDKRIEALLPFIHCIRKNLLVVTGVTIDAEAFKKLPSHMFQFFGNNPIFVAFARAMLHVIDFTPEKDKITFICDDEEQVALDFYRLYRRLKKVWPPARKKVGGICFVDDEYLFALQAADFVAALLRLEAGKLWYAKEYDYSYLYEALTKEPHKSERIMVCDIAFGDKSMLTDLANSLRPEYERLQKLQNETPKQRVRKI